MGCEVELKCGRVVRDVQWVGGWVGGFCGVRGVVRCGAVVVKYTGVGVCAAGLAWSAHIGGHDIMPRATGVGAGRWVSEAGGCARGTIRCCGACWIC